MNAEQMRACTLEVDLFHLTDTSYGYEPENRTLLRTVNFGTIPEEELEMYYDEKFLAKVEVLFPLSAYSNDLNYREIKAISFESLKEQRTYDNYPAQFLKLRRDSPLEEYITHAMDKKKRGKVYDPDATYFPMTGDYFIDLEERRRVESQNPYVYAQYRLLLQSGCVHKASGVFIKCKCGYLAGCVTCHENSMIDHETEVVGYYCRFCDHEFTDYTEFCPSCRERLTNHFCYFCKIYDLSDPEYMPYCHCPECNICHPCMTERIRRHCVACGNCYNLEDFETHYCSIEQELCMVCGLAILPDYERHCLSCSRSHKLHQACYNYLMDHNTFGCPLCRKSMLDEDTIVFYKLKTAETILFRKGYERIDALYQFCCNDCQLVFYDVGCSFCHYCTGINMSLLNTQPIQPMEVNALFKGLCKNEEYQELQSFMLKFPYLYRYKRKFLDTLLELVGIRPDQ